MLAFMSLLSSMLGLLQLQVMELGLDDSRAIRSSRGDLLVVCYFLLLAFFFSATLVGGTFFFSLGQMSFFVHAVDVATVDSECVCYQQLPSWATNATHCNYTPLRC